MNGTIEPSAFWQALQDVDDGQEPHDVYARVMSESVESLRESIEEEIFQEVEEAHSDNICRAKHGRNGLGYCHGDRCVWVDGTRFPGNCPCKCHEHEETE